MNALGKVPEYISSCEVLQAMGENIILADRDYNVVWLNPAAVELLSYIAPLYGLEKVEDLIGMNMSAFHRNPTYQRAVMANLSESHRARINIKDTYVTDIVINPIKNEDEEIIGYVVMLIDVTTKAQEEERKEDLIQKLSVPVVEIWDHAVAVPLIGPLDVERFDFILSTLLDKCRQSEAKYVVINLSGVTGWHKEISYQIGRMVNVLSILGTQCLIVGIKPELAIKLVDFSTSTPTFSTTKAAIKYIISKQ